MDNKITIKLDQLSSENIDLKDIQSFEGLYEVLRRMSGIQDGKTIWSPDMLIEVIEDIRTRSGEYTLETLPSRFNLRDVVATLSLKKSH